jgi:hypothetical protein
MTRLARTLRPLALALALGLTSATAYAQAPADPANPNADEGGVGQGPVPGYIAAGLLSAAVVFVLCKSARR